MTKKELLYLQDVSSHAEQIKKLCELCKQSVTDPDLKSFIDSVASESQNTYCKVSQYLGGCN